MNTEDMIIRDAAMLITRRSKRYCGPNSVRTAAKRIGVLKLDDRGMSVVPRPVVEKMAKNFAQAGVLDLLQLPDAPLEPEFRYRGAGAGT